MTHLPALRLSAALLPLLLALSAPAALAAPRAKAAPKPPPSASARAVQGDYIVAIVNDEALSNREVQQAASQIAAQLSAQKQAVPPRAKLLAIALDELITHKAVLQAARRSGITVSDEDLQHAEAALAQSRDMSPQQLRSTLKAQNQHNDAQYRAALKDQVMLERLRDEVGRSGAAAITDGQALEFLRQQRQKQASHSGAAPLINLAQVLIVVPAGADEAQAARLQAKAQEALEKIRAGADFARVVRDYSAGAGRDSGGVMGLLPTERYPAVFVQAIAQVPTGQTTGLVRSEAGWHILKVVDRQQPDAALMQTASHARHILLRANSPKEISAALRRLTALRADIVAGKVSFEEAARAHSQDASARAGGDLGWAQEGQFVPEFEQQLDRLQTGQISPAFASRYGAHIVQLIERRAEPMNQTQQLELARAALRQERAQQARAQWESKVRSSAYVDMRAQPQ